MNIKLKILIVVVIAIVCSTVSGAFFATNFLVSPVYIRLRNPVVKRTSAQEYAELEDRVRKNMTYADIPPKNRVKTFDILRDDNKIELIKAKHALALQFYDITFKNI